MATILTSAALRRELAARALIHANAHALHHPHETTAGHLPSIVFTPYTTAGQETETPAHGNFHPASYRAILANPAFAARLAKSYTSARRIPHRHHPDRNRPRRELDCATSSDALLMNIFCHPQTLAQPATRALLGLTTTDTEPPIFGYHPRLPLPSGRTKKPLTDRTEIDLYIGSLLIEAKLTESDFQRSPLASVQRYPSFTEIFDSDLLPIEDPDIPRPMLHSYQLIRGVLAAHHEQKRFVVLCDHRRADLIERWFLILRAIRPYDLRGRCALLTWQELSATLPTTLQRFLATKYGIDPA